MWFKNIRAYRLENTITEQPEQLDEQLKESAFTPCSGFDVSRMGWVPPMGPDGLQWVHSCNDYHLLTARTQQKLLPPAAIKEILDEKVRERELAEDRKLRRKEKLDLKDEIIHTLLPRALTRSQLTRGFICGSKNLLLIEASTPAKAEDFLNLLRDSLGSLPVKPLMPKHAPADLMTRWLTGARLPTNFALGAQCDLRDPLQASNVIRCRNQEMATAEIRQHLDAGKQSFSLGLVWADRLNLVLHEDFSVRGLKYEDVIENETGIDSELDPAARFDADFALMSMELDALVSALIEIFGDADSD